MRGLPPGQGHLWRSLDFHLGRGPQAFLITGAPGYGKTAIAREAARRLLCVGDDPEGECRSCRLVLAKEHPDLTEVWPEGAQWRVGEVRRVEESTARPPALGPRRVVILAGIEGMTLEAASIFLKLLEEPPPGNYFFLLASAPGRLPATIRSRCQVLTLRPVPREELAAWLMAELGLDPERAREIAEIAGGNPGLARRLVEEELPVLGELAGPLRPLELAAAWQEKGPEGLYRLELALREERRRGKVSPGVWAKAEEEILKAEKRLKANQKKDLVWESLFLAWRRLMGEDGDGQGGRG